MTATDLRCQISMSFCGMDGRFQREVKWFSYFICWGYLGVYGGGENLNSRGTELVSFFWYSLRFWYSFMKIDALQFLTGERQANINIADGKKNAVILESEAAKIDQVNRAQGQSALLFQLVLWKYTSAFLEWFSVMELIAQAHTQLSIYHFTGF